MTEAGERPRDYYGLARIRDSLFHFVFGKGFSAFSALAVVVLIIRELPIAAYAIYATLHAVVMMLRLLTSFGVNATVLRFIPDLRVVANNVAAYRLLFGGVALRAAFYVVPVALVYWLAGDRFVTLLGLEGFEWAFLLYLVVGFFRISGLFYAGALESLLWQKQTQYSIAFSNLTKLAGICVLIYLQQFSLRNVILLELSCEVLTMLLMLTTSIWSWRRDPARHQGEAATLAQETGRYVRFSFWAYLFNLTAVLHGSAPNRLIAAAFMSTTQMALFGAVDRLIQLVKQYEPVKLLMGLFRPVFNSKYRSREDFPAIMAMADSMFRFNLVVLALPLLPIAVAGEPIFDLISNGKYADGYLLFLGFFGVLALGSLMMVLELLVKAVELTKIFTLSNIVLSGSVFLAFPFFSKIGLWALVVANCSGYVVANTIVMAYLGMQGFHIRFSVSNVLKIIGVTALAIVCGRGLLALMPPGWWPAACVVAWLTFLLGLRLVPPFTREELGVAKSLLAAKGAARAH